MFVFYLYSIWLHYKFNKHAHFACLLPFTYDLNVVRFRCFSYTSYTLATKSIDCTVHFVADTVDSVDFDKIDGVEVGFVTSVYEALNVRTI